MSNETDQGIAGVGLLIAAYADENGADETLAKLKQARKDKQIDYDDAAVVRRDAKGKVHTRETEDMSTGKGAGIGALVGGVIGLLAGPVGLAAAAAAGAGVGALAAHKDAGFDNDTLKEIGGALPNGTSALAVTTSKDFVEAVRKEAPEQETLSLARDIATEISDRLNARQDVLVALVLTEEGVAATKIVSTPEAVAVFGISATEDGVVAGRAVATDKGAVYEVAETSGDDAAYEEGVVTDEGTTVIDTASTTVEEEAG